MIARIASVALILCGLALLAFTSIEHGALPEPHSKRSSMSTHKAGLPILDAQDAQRQLSELASTIAQPASLERANRIVASAIVRYWPKPEERDREVVRDFGENWLLALIQRIELWAGPARPDLSVYERREYRTALAKGVGICSQSALALADFLNRHGIETRIAGLDGHVVTVAATGGRSFILDPDYGVVLAMTMAEAEADPARVSAAYVSRGYPTATALHVARLYGHDGNKVVRPADYMANAVWRIRLTEIGCWLIPLASILLGVLLLGRTQSHVRVSTSAPSATR